MQREAAHAQQHQVPDLVSRKTEGTKLGLEVPDHDAAIQATRDQLFHVVVEGNRGYCILVTAKGPLQSRILGLRTCTRSAALLWKALP